MLRTGGTPVPLRHPGRLIGVLGAIDVTHAPEAQRPERASVFDILRAAIRERKIGAARGSARPTAVVAALFQNAGGVVAAVFTQVHVKITVIKFLFPEQRRVARMNDVRLPDARGICRDVSFQTPPVRQWYTGLVGKEIVEAIDEKAPARRIGDIIGRRITDALR